MHAFTAIITLAIAALASAQAPPAGPPAGPPPQGEPCPPQFKLQCCQHVISAQDASLFKINVDPKVNPGLASTGCKFLMILRAFYMSSFLPRDRKLQMTRTLCTSLALGHTEMLIYWYRRQPRPNRHVRHPKLPSLLQDCTGRLQRWLHSSIDDVMWRWMCM
jgi:hypothetical protein